MRLLVQFLPYRGAMGRHLDVLRKSPIRYVFAITIVNAIVCAVVAANRKDLFIQEFIEIYDILVARIDKETRPMLRYHAIREKSTRVLDLTSLIPNEFELIVPVFERCFQERMAQWTMTGKP